ncbi:MAG: D-Ala-D-Ala carboxypeptidase family metallohydrolase [Thermodesulfobacteriota bacterium]
MKSKRKTIKKSGVQPIAKPLSPNFLLADLIFSDTALKKGIRNTPTKAALKNLKHLAATLEQVVELLGHPISISSGYRSKALNAAIGGSKTSQHTQGLAADFTCKNFGTPFSVCKKITNSGIRFDQLILEYGTSRKIAWVHLGVGPKKRCQVLTICTNSNFSRDGLHRYRKKQA